MTSKRVHVDIQMQVLVYMNGEEPVRQIARPLIQVDKEGVRQLTTQRKQLKVWLLSNNWTWNI